MKTLIPILMLATAAVVLGAPEAPKTKGIFSTLKAGQSVNLKNDGAAYSITVYDGDLPTSHTVVEIGENYVVFQDVAGVTETTVPVYSVKSIEKMNLKVE